MIEYNDWHLSTNKIEGWMQILYLRIHSNWWIHLQEMFTLLSVIFSDVSSPSSSAEECDETSPKITAKKINIFWR